MCPSVCRPWLNRNLHLFKWIFNLSNWNPLILSYYENTQTSVCSVIMSTLSMAGLCVGPRFFSVWLQKRIIYLFDKSNEQQGIISFIVSFWNENSLLGVVGKFVEGPFVVLALMMILLELPYQRLSRIFIVLNNLFLFIFRWWV